MGASDFRCRAKGETSQVAFVAAREQAFYDYGHRGYTGTIAEKTGYIMISVPSDLDLTDPAKVSKWIEKQVDKNPSIQDKWGPAGCIYLGDDEYAFFGWASS